MLTLRNHNWHSEAKDIVFNKCTVLEKLLRHDQFIKLIFTLVTRKHLGVFCGCIQVIADKTHRLNYSDIENSVHTCLIETFSGIDFPFCWCFLLQAPDKVYCCTTSDPAMVLIKRKQCVYSPQTTKSRYLL